MSIENRFIEKLLLLIQYRTCQNSFCKCVYGVPFQIENGKIINYDLKSILNWVEKIDIETLQDGCLLKEIKELVVKELIKEKQNGKSN